MRLRHLTIAGAVVASSLALTLVATGGASGASLPNTSAIPGACALDLSANHSHCDLSLLANLKGEPKAAAAPARSQRRLCIDFPPFGLRRELVRRRRLLAPTPPKGRACHVRKTTAR